MDKEEDKLLVRIAQMYYQEDKTQNQISKELNIHRSTISRLLKKSREEGIVTISINYNKAGTYSLEEALEEKYQLKKAIVVPAGATMNYDQKLHLLGEAANEYIHVILEDHMVLGFSWGQAMSAFSEELKQGTKRNLLCIPMVGGPAGRLKSEYHVNTITYEASKNLGCHALLIDAPAFPETIELKKALMENEFNQKLIQYWRDISIAIFGIGSPKMKESDRWLHFYGEDIFKHLEEKHVVGDVISRFFGKDGDHIPNELDDCIIGIDINELKRIPFRIGIAESLEKSAAIKGALLGGYANIIVTTEETAEALLS
ncbi:sugar-binding transcriptional regulator [Enterococcus casseliflavus]|uniref:sugar-binding transcriptional regulator n=1 Tax=Enterococcus casseliflavus TaxID=37734 RepID=UPI00301AAACB